MFSNNLNDITLILSNSDKITKIDQMNFIKSINLTLII